MNISAVVAKRQTTARPTIRSVFPFRERPLTAWKNVSASGAPTGRHRPASGANPQRQQLRVDRVPVGRTVRGGCRAPTPPPHVPTTGNAWSAAVSTAPAIFPVVTRDRWAGRNRPALDPPLLFKPLPPSPTDPEPNMPVPPTAAHSLNSRPLLPRCPATPR